ncbi:hypothetical protein A6A25_26650 [Saccharothrix sp. CB00851]|nr:hypothetical protein A6A25_26650 [Saccharothrix sp. CB00851]
MVSAPRNPFTRRSLLRGALGAATAGALAACGSHSTAPITSGGVDLRIWTHDPGYVTTFTKAAADPALTGGSKFAFRPRTTSVAPGDIVTRMIAQAVADGNTPDLAGLVIDQFPRVMGSVIAENLFVDLTDTVAPLGDDLLKLAPYAVGGKPYGLDSDNSITVLYYRQDVFAEHGVPEDVSTWEELAEHGERLARDEQISLGMVSVGDNGAIVNGYTQMLLQRGGRAAAAAPGAGRAGRVVVPQQLQQPAVAAHRHQ